MPEANHDEGIAAKDTDGEREWRWQRARDREALR